MHPRSELGVWVRSQSGRMELGVTQQGTCAVDDQSIGPYDKESIELELAAASLERDYIYGVLGRGAMGATFKARLPSGIQVALKLAPSVAFGWANGGLWGWLWHRHSCLAWTVSAAR
ncbi:hypothetical protein WJX75_004490 [Coccomyxa subellipsoidea]|uniref:Protein kinase domain-containing protein n=1 Tax=Coccomyxa subellipsoidea TaxID=248742 RepID=A0ABR2YTE0_9CHLO